MKQALKRACKRGRTRNSIRKAKENIRKDTILRDMAAVREKADKAESLTAAEYWPFPSYTELLYHN